MFRCVEGSNTTGICPARNSANRSRLTPRRPPRYRIRIGFHCTPQVVHDSSRSRRFFRAAESDGTRARFCVIATLVRQATGRAACKRQRPPAGRGSPHHPVGPSLDSRRANPAPPRQTRMANLDRHEVPRRRSTSFVMPTDTPQERFNGFVTVCHPVARRTGGTVTTTSPAGSGPLIRATKLRMLGKSVALSALTRG